MAVEALCCQDGLADALRCGWLRGIQTGNGRKQYGHRADYPASHSKPMW
jgi:hypothetical protein